MTATASLFEKPTAPEVERRWDTEALALALRARFPSPEWAFFREVRNATGFSRVTRSADGIAMNLWPSRGLEVHGFEIKAHRSDWLRELKQPEKAQEISRYCDRWWIVAAPGVVASGELPPTWGLLEPRGKSLVVKTDAPHLTAQPLERSFIAALLRVASESQASKKEIEAAIAKACEGHERGVTEAIERDRRDRSSAYADLRKSVDDFQARSGVKIDDWRGDNIGEAVAFVRAHGLTGYSGIQRQIERARDAAKALEALASAALVDLAEQETVAAAAPQPPTQEVA